MSDIMKKRAAKIKKRIKEAINENGWILARDSGTWMSAISGETGKGGEGDYIFDIYIYEEKALVYILARYKIYKITNQGLDELLNDFNLCLVSGAYYESADSLIFKSGFYYHDSLISTEAISNLLLNMLYCMDNADDLVDGYVGNCYSYEYCDTEFLKRDELYQESLGSGDDIKAKSIYNLMCSALERGGYEINRTDELNSATLLTNGVEIDRPMLTYCCVDKQTESIRYQCELPALFGDDRRDTVLTVVNLLNHVSKVGAYEMFFGFDLAGIRLKVDIPYTGSIISKDLIAYVLDEVLDEAEKYNKDLYDLAGGEITLKEFLDSHSIPN